MTTNLGKVVTYHEALVPIKSHDTQTTWSWKIMRQTKAIISPLPPTMHITTILGRLMTYLEAVQSM